MQRSLALESEAAVQHAERAHFEALELSKARQLEHKQRRALQGQIDTLKSEMEDADRARRSAQGELSNKQRQHTDQLRQHRSLAAEREGARAEAQQLREQLQRTERSLEAAQAELRSAARERPPATPEVRGGGKYRQLSRPVQRSATPEGRDGFPARDRDAGREDPADEVPSEVGPSVVTDGAISALARDREHGTDAYREPSTGARAVAVSQGNAGGAKEPPVWSDASARLFEVIERAKERADQRRLLTGAAKDVKAQARALEELLSADGCAPEEEALRPQG
jgi:hypothetical protein